MKTFREFMEEFRYLPKAKMDKKIEDRKNKEDEESNSTKRIKLIRNVLGKNTNLSKSDLERNAENSGRMFNKRVSDDNLTPEKAQHYVDTTKKSSDIQKEIINARDLKSNKKNPTEQDKLKREYELTKQAVKNRSETDTKRIINAKKRLEKSYDNSLEEKIIFHEYDDVIQSLNNLEKRAKNLLDEYFGEK